MKKIYLMLLLALPSLASAHTGHDQGSFMSGFLHPIGGLDHVLAMLAVGLWAASFKGAARGLIPATFVIVMMAGFALGLKGFELPQLEAGIAASVVVLGILVAMARQIPAALAMALVGVFALFHGAAHGAELAGSSAAAFGAGFVLMTAALHGAGFGLATGFNARAWLIRLSGLAISATGIYLLVA